MQWDVLILTILAVVRVNYAIDSLNNSGPGLGEFAKTDIPSISDDNFKSGYPIENNRQNTGQRFPNVRVSHPQEDESVVDEEDEYEEEEYQDGIDTKEIRDQISRGGRSTLALTNLINQLLSQRGQTTIIRRNRPRCRSKNCRRGKNCNLNCYCFCSPKGNGDWRISNLHNLCWPYYNRNLKPNSISQYGSNSQLCNFYDPYYTQNYPTNAQGNFYESTSPYYYGNVNVPRFQDGQGTGGYGGGSTLIGNGPGIVDDGSVNIGRGLVNVGVAPINLLGTNVNNVS